MCNVRFPAGYNSCHWGWWLWLSWTVTCMTRWRLILTTEYFKEIATNENSFTSMRPVGVAVQKTLIKSHPTMNMSFFVKISNHWAPTPLLWWKVKVGTGDKLSSEKTGSHFMHKSGCFVMIADILSWEGQWWSLNPRFVTWSVISIYLLLQTYGNTWQVFCQSHEAAFELKSSPYVILVKCLEK